MFSGIAVVTLATLNMIRQLVELGVIELPKQAFTDPVVVTDSEVVIECEAYESDVGADLGDVESGGPLPAHFRPVQEAAAERRAQRQASQSD